MTVVARRGVVGVGASIHINGAPGVRTSDVEDEDSLQFFQLDELHAVGRLHLAGGAGGLAPGVRFEPVRLPIFVQRLCPRLEGNLRVGGKRRRHHAFGQPHAFLAGRRALQQHATGDATWCRRRGTASAASATRRLTLEALSGIRRRTGTAPASLSAVRYANLDTLALAILTLAILTTCRGGLLAVWLRDEQREYADGDRTLDPRPHQW